MPSHVRKQIRDYVQARLVGLPTTASSVYVGQTRPLPKAHAPTLLIYTRQESDRAAVAGRPPLLERSCTLHIEGRVSLATEPDDMLDQIALEVERAMGEMVDYTRGTIMGGLVQRLALQATEMVAQADGERQIGGVRLEYLVTYRTAQGAPDSVA